MSKKTRVMLVGASVGKDWKLSEFPERSNNQDLAFESMIVYQFDKAEALEEVLMRPKRKFKLTKKYLKGFLEPSPEPVDTIIIKECAAYFPGDLDTYKRSVSAWIKLLRDANKQVVIATVVPVTQRHAQGKKGRIESILEFNDWVRETSVKEKITLLDLEAAVSTDTRFLNDEFTSGDGLHLNKKGYEMLDRALNDVFTAKQAGKSAR